MSSYSLPATPVQQPQPRAVTAAAASPGSSHLLPVPPAAHPAPHAAHQRGAASASSGAITLTPYSAPNTPQSYDPKLHAKTAPALMQAMHAAAQPPETGKIGEQTKRNAAAAASAASIMPNGRSARATSVTKGHATAPPPGVSVSSDHLMSRPRSATTVGASALPSTPERESRRNSSSSSSAVQNLSGTFDAVSSGSNSGGPSPAGSPSPAPHSLSTAAAPSFPTQHPHVPIRHRPSLALNPSHYTGSTAAANGADGAFSPSGLVSPSPLSASFRGRSRACSVAVDQASLLHMTSEQKDALIETQARELATAQDHLQKAGEYGSDLMQQLEELQNDKQELQEQLNMARASSYAAQSHGGSSNGGQSTADPSLLASFEAFSAFVRVELLHSNHVVTGEAAQDLAAFQRLLKAQRHAAREERSKAAAREEEAARLLANQRAQLNSFAQRHAEWTTQQTQLSQVQSSYEALEIHCAELQAKLRIQASQAHATGQVTSQQYEAEREEWQNELDRTKEAARAESMKLRNAITNLRQQLAAANSKLVNAASSPSSANANAPLSATVVPAPTSLLLNLQEGADEAETAEDSNDFKIVEPSASGSGIAGAPHRRKASVSLADDLETAPTEPPSPSLSARPSPRSRAASVIASMPAVPEVNSSGDSSSGGKVLGSDAEADVAVAGGVLAGDVTVSSLKAALTALQVQLALAKESAALLITSERDRQAQRDGWHEAEELWQFERARVREAEQQAQTIRLEELTRERALQAEVTEGRSYEATIVELRTQLREAREDRDESSASLADSLRTLTRQLADKENEISNLRERIEQQPAAIAAAVSAATLKAVSGSQNHAQATAAGHWTPPPYRSGSSGNESSSSSTHALLPPDFSAASSSRLQPSPLPQPSPGAPSSPLTFGSSPAAAASAGVSAGASAGASAVASPSTLLAPASSSPSLPATTSKDSVVLDSSAMKVAIVSSTRDVIRAVQGGNRATRWFLVLLFLFQLLLVSCWLVLTHGGSAALADHPFTQSMMRSLLGEEARRMRYS